jgi:hypothetical protein
MGMMLGTVADGSLQEVSFMTGMTFTCPRCGRDRAKTPDGLWRGFGEAVDASDLTAEQLTILGRYLSDAPSDVTPEDLVHAFPAAAPIINFTVHKHGSDWLTFLAIIVAVLVGYWAHLDSEKAASQSRPQPEGALRLTDEDIAKIAAQVERNLRHEQAKNARENKEQRKPGSK